MKLHRDGDGEMLYHLHVMPALSCLFPLLGVQSVEVQLENQMVLVQTTLPSQEVQALLESTGRQAVLKGMGSSQLRE